ncbi:hypothetical protein Ocin01_06170 [Orchesella cincta]|uniref:Uncharacterized protein n=1 Tax=Orchesella cincta TaxID=48709 RepID=A0A1D2N5G4_ORCCI|nr:hypothetical protein Ocin01_06170 [Orchesella cincta]
MSTSTLYPRHGQEKSVFGSKSSSNRLTTDDMPSLAMNTERKNCRRYNIHLIKWMDESDPINHILIVLLFLFEPQPRSHRHPRSGASVVAVTSPTPQMFRIYMMKGAAEWGNLQSSLLALTTTMMNVSKK